MMPDEFATVRILLVEDEEFIRGTIKRMLSRFANVQLREAADGIEGLTQLDERGCPDLILCDVKMAQMDGLTFVRLLRESRDPARAAIPVIVLTSDSDANTVRTVLGFGACSYLLKPFSAKLLAERVDQMLRRVQGPQKALRATAVPQFGTR